MLVLMSPISSGDRSKSVYRLEVHNLTAIIGIQVWMYMFMLVASCMSPYDVNMTNYQAFGAIYDLCKPMIKFVMPSFL